jgi:hypothetical protein
MNRNHGLRCGNTSYHGMRTVINPMSDYREWKCPIAGCEYICNAFSDEGMQIRKDLHNHAKHSVYVDPPSLPGHIYDPNTLELTDFDLEMMKKARISGA